jgi:hypothetical protein
MSDDKVLSSLQQCFTLPSLSSVETYFETLLYYVKQWTTLTSWNRVTSRPSSNKYLYALHVLATVLYVYCRTSGSHTLPNALVQCLQLPAWDKPYRLTYLSSTVNIHPSSLLDFIHNHAQSNPHDCTHLLMILQTEQEATEHVELAYRKQYFLSSEQVSTNVSL